MGFEPTCAGFAKQFESKAIQHEKGPIVKLDDRPSAPLPARCHFYSASIAARLRSRVVWA